MFCPVCKSEYRPGFTECSDCGVPLVETLGGASAASSNPVNPENAMLLWSGTSRAAAGAIRQALDDAKISHHDTFHDAGPLPGLTTEVNAIFVHARDRDAARAALENAKEQLIIQPADDNASDDLEGAEGPAVDDEHAEDLEQPLEPTGYVPEDFNPEDATLEVWSGNGRSTIWGLEISLKENGIGCATTIENGTHHLRVMPADEARAREIIGEILKASSDP